VRELVERIQRDGKRVVLASSAKQDELEHFKKVTNIADLLEGETSADDAEKSKPEPDIFLAALTEAGNPDPREAIVVGDTLMMQSRQRRRTSRLLGYSAAASRNRV
jgi:HAD superfamily hydrolase (TIGR01549 family)